MLAWPATEIPELPGSGLPILVADTASNRLQLPVSPGADARLYVCGITPYDSTHMGHASTYVAFDLLNRAWRDSGSKVCFVENVTDIDDPLFERALKTGQSWETISLREMSRFRDDMTALRVLPPDAYVTVTQHMDAIINWIESLIAQGCTYRLGEDLYFDVSSSSAFGSVSNLPSQEMLTLFAERGGDPLREGKRSPLDPILWVGPKQGEPSWQTPFGSGRPGWHVECVAIALDHLGGPLSVQGGGRDLIFPHHEMCAAQAAASGRVDHFADVFMHAGMVSLNGQKMSKSLGNLVFISDLCAAGVDPMAIRATILGHHYSQDWEWTSDKLDVATERINRWRQALSMPAGADGLALLQQMRIALAQNLDSPQAMAAVDDWAQSTLSGDNSDETAQGTVARTLDALLGLAL